MTWIVSQHWLLKGLDLERQGRYPHAILCYLKSEEAKPKGRTERQKEVQRLWQQRGLLERTRFNLISVSNLIQPLDCFRQINDGIKSVNYLIERNRKDMSTIKERISK